MARMFGGPMVLTVVYGFWAANIQRDAGAVTGWNAVFGVVSGVLVGLVYLVVREMAPALPRGRRALLWAAFIGVAFGFIYSLTGATILRCVIMALAVTVPTFLAFFYRFFTEEVPDHAPVSPREPLTAGTESAMGALGTTGTGTGTTGTTGTMGTSPSSAGRVDDPLAVGRASAPPGAGRAAAPDPVRTGEAAPSSAEVSRLHRRLPGAKAEGSSPSHGISARLAARRRRGSGTKDV
ncbi:hypothetical protein B1H18_22125 [Streptomyces tsukubensis]|uniref:Uncharacterized protein n=2 Tax=Streptomyces tsukubensis TaxID=83656 RepID=A0A1V4A5H6_9ACTN|nr:hypothetical protein B1H18_22125 [Streptomyces tsukubensis]